MAAIFRTYPGRIDIYRNRYPKSDGAEPWLVLPVIVGLIWVVFLSCFLFFLVYDIWKNNFIGFLSLGVSVGMLGWYVLSKFGRVVFDADSEEVYSAFFFIKRRLASFKEIREIDVREQELAGRTRYSYVAYLRNRMKDPVRLSPQVWEMANLARYYYDVIPAVEEMLGESSAAVHEVAVDEVEVPDEEARHYVAAAPARAAAGGTARVARETRTAAAAPRGRTTTVAKRTQAAAGDESGDEGAKRHRPPRSGLKFFSVDGPVYSRSLVLFHLGSLAFYIVVVYAGVWCHFDWYTMLNPGFFSLMVNGIIVAATLINMFRENLNLVIDAKRRTISFRTAFGFVHKKFHFDDVQRFTIKSMFGQKALCMVLDDQAVDPTVANSMTRDRLMRALEETCAIMGLEPGEWLDR